MKLVLIPEYDVDSETYSFEIGVADISLNEIRCECEVNSPFKSFYKGELIEIDSPNFFVKPKKRTFGESLSIESIQGKNVYNLVLHGLVSVYRKRMGTNIYDEAFMICESTNEFFNSLEGKD